MITVPVAGLDTFASQATFRSLLTSLSRPGSVVDLPVPGLGAAVVPLALADVETTVAVIGDRAVAEIVVRATGAAASPVEDAELVACCGRTAASTVARLSTGSALAPELGTKVGIDCDRLVAGGPGQLTVTVSGPGVKGATRLGVDGLDAEVLEAVAAANADPPVGIDVWLVDQSGHIVGLPRSCRLEVA